MARYIAQFIGIVVVSVWLAGAFVAQAQEARVVVYYFYGEGCPYCAQAGRYLSTLAIRDEQVTVRYFEVWNDVSNDALMKYVVPQFGGNANGVPRMVIGSRVVSGFSQETTPAAIEQAIAMAQSRPDPNPAQVLIGQWQASQSAQGTTYGEKNSYVSGTGLVTVLVLAGGTVVASLVGLLVAQRRRR